MKFFEEARRLAWWVEITTVQPYCTYFFGPFESRQEAELFLPGYIEDIEQEGCEKIGIQLKQCKPQELTVFEEEQQMIL